jgi:serine/tyrosine/threonine adenylyltransferase
MLQNVTFTTPALDYLPVDENSSNEVRPYIPGKVFSLVPLQPLEDPVVVCLSQNALASIAVEVDSQDPDTPAYLSASKAISNSLPYAHCYCGYQFGLFSGVRTTLCLAQDLVYKACRSLTGLVY